MIVRHRPGIVASLCHHGRQRVAAQHPQHSVLVRGRGVGGLRVVGLRGLAAFCLDMLGRVLGRLHVPLRHGQGTPLVADCLDEPVVLLAQGG